MLTQNTSSAKQADVINTAIKESGKYIGVITRAESLTSKNGNQGVGISFKSDNGERFLDAPLAIQVSDGNRHFERIYLRNLTLSDLARYEHGIAGGAESELALSVALSEHSLRKNRKS